MADADPRLPGDDGAMRFLGHLPFEGEIVWLTAAQGGRNSRPPLTPSEQDYTATAFVPPQTAQPGRAAFVVRVENRDGWRSRAFASCLFPDAVGDRAVVPGAVIVLTEELRWVAFFRVDHIEPDPLPEELRLLDLNSLVGLAEEVACRYVMKAGGTFRSTVAGHPAVTLDYVSNRVTAYIADGHVVEIHGFS
jgi:hypothetical protein